MSGSVAEALLASGSKKLPLLPAPPKRKKEPKTFCFDLELTESTDQSYPEFSWTELVRGAKEKELSNKAASGNPVLDPFASDDEDDLKAMAAKFEAKYNSGPPKKKKRRVEDYIDRGAGYDETDPFIDNSDVYDEVVPPDLETVRGGFYINSGSLDFKEVELSEDEEDSASQANKTNSQQQPPKKAKVKITPTLQERSQIQKDKNPVGRPPGTGIKKQLSKDNTNALKKRRVIVTPIVPGGKKPLKPGSKLARIKAPPPTPNADTLARETTKLLGNPSTLARETTKLLGNPATDLIKVKPSGGAKKLPSSSGSSSTDDSGSGSSSSDSDSSSSEETEEKQKTKLQKVTKNPVPGALPLKSNTPAAEVTSVLKPKPVPSVVRQVDPNMPNLKKNNTTQPPVKRVKTKNVPLNPKLRPNLSQPSLPSSSSTPPPPQPSSGVKASPPPPPPLLQPQKALNSKDLIKSNGTSSSLLMNLNARAQSQTGSSPSSSGSNNASPVPTRAPTPKPSVSTPSMSPSSSLTISAVTPNTANSKLTPNSNPPVKTKAKAKQSPGSSMSSSSSNMPTFSTADIISSINNYSLSNFGNLNFISQMSANMKAGMNMNMMSSQKTMPNLKKIPPQQGGASTSERLVQPKPKAAKVVKPKAKPAVDAMGGNSTLSSSTSGLSGNLLAGNTPTTSTSNLTSGGAYKTPPSPLGGPGVEISKVRSGSGSLNNVPKSSPNTSSSPLNLGNATVYSSVSPATSTAAALNSIFSSPNSLVNSGSSSLTVQRLPHSITITPSGHYSGGSATTTKSSNTTRNYATNYHEFTKATKHITSFDVQALLQGSNYTSSLMSLNSSSAAGGSKSSGANASKPSNSIVDNSRELPRK